MYLEDAISKQIYAKVLIFVSLNLKAIFLLNAKVSQLLLKCYFLLFEPNILLHYIVINNSYDLPCKQHKNQTSTTYDC